MVAARLVALPVPRLYLQFFAVRSELGDVKLVRFAGYSVRCPPVPTWAPASPRHVDPSAALARQLAARYAWIAALGRDGGGTPARQATTSCSIGAKRARRQALSPAALVQAACPTREDAHPFCITAVRGGAAAHSPFCRGSRSRRSQPPPNPVKDQPGICGRLAGWPAAGGGNFIGVCHAPRCVASERVAAPAVWARVPRA